MANHSAFLSDMESRFLSFANPAMKPASSATVGLPLTSLAEALACAGLYLTFCYFGSRAMSRRKEIVSLKGLQAVYNAVQVVLCGYMTVKAALLARQRGYSLLCNSFDHREAGELATIVYIFYASPILSKALDFLDTVFIIMHKKDRQLSFLHVYHHTTIFLTYWMNARVFYGGDIYFTVVANGGIHTIMYGYYGLSMLKGRFPFLAPLLSAARPIITLSQLVQFVSMMTQAIFILANDCDSPQRITYWYLGYIFSLFLLFFQFAVRNYCSKRGNKAKRQ